MTLKRTTPVPNIILDTFLPTLNKSEIKVLLVVIRQTYGWIDHRTGSRKKFEWIAKSIFEKRTGLSKRVISTAIEALIHKGIIEARAANNGKPLSASERQGKHRLYFGVSPTINQYALVQKTTLAYAKKWGQ